MIGWKLLFDILFKLLGVLGSFESQVFLLYALGLCPLFHYFNVIYTDIKEWKILRQKESTYQFTEFLFCPYIRTRERERINIQDLLSFFLFVKPKSSTFLLLVYIYLFAQAGKVLINLIVVGSGMLAKAFVQAYRQALASKCFGCSNLMLGIASIYSPLLNNVIIPTVIIISDKLLPVVLVF